MNNLIWALKRIFKATINNDVKGISGGLDRLLNVFGEGVRFSDNMMSIDDGERSIASKKPLPWAAVAGLHDALFFHMRFGANGRSRDVGRSIGVGIIASVIAACAPALAAPTSPSPPMLPVETRAASSSDHRHRRW